MVQFVDGSVKAQLGLPDMKLPIQYALSFPERLINDYSRTDFPLIQNLSFFEPDMNKYECLQLAYDVLAEGGTAPCILNAANEVAVGKFLNGEIGFTKIPEIINQSLEKVVNHKNPDLEMIIECDKLARDFVSSLS
jgi:1-deoxy-D-xylulose-5-phosphate reductoisomerase